MTEQEWLQTADEVAMAHRIEANSTDRKWHYYAIACCRRISPLLPHPASLQGIDVLEEFVEGRASPEDVDAISWKVEGAAFAFDYYQERSDHNTRGWIRLTEMIPISVLKELVNDPSVQVEDTRKLLTTAAYFVDRCVSTSAVIRDVSTLAKTFQSRQLLHDIFGNPFRPVTFDPAWRTSAVHALASQMYDSRDFTPMPNLADSLEDAGCEHADILAHCRGPGPHVRGCWVVDLILGKS